ncbi:MAG: UDP-N-acetylmuramoyl-tripeptide--D-alanyl-D-alanine ligase [Anaerovoracaceae bacterium]|jgi:UDP-N-acetylmuramoyl-tripeptide--D-alanyl-D-alanine ligase
MYEISMKQAAEAAGGRLIKGDPDAVIRGVGIDSRTVKEDEIFVAVTGENQDAHKFIPMAVERGCRAVMASRKEAVENLEGVNVILVDDTLDGLQEMAKWYLGTLNVKKIAVTGSIGKTTTRDMLYFTLKQKYRTGKPENNLNNQFGVPLTIFTFDKDLEVAVLEAGMEHFGEMHRLANVIRPDVAVITMIGISHMENLGSREKIFESKMQITDFFNEDSVLVINDDNDILSKEACKGNYKVLSIGTGEGEDVVVSGIVDHALDGIEFDLTDGDETRHITFGIPGAHNALNGALAYLGAKQFGATLDDFQAGLDEMAGVGLTGRRLMIKEGNGFKVIDDSYNAAPDSMKSALNTLSLTEGKRRIAIMANMNELGVNSVQEHFDCGAYAVDKGIDLVIGVADKGIDYKRGAESRGGAAMWFATKEDLIRELPNILQEGDVILTKASMTLHLGEVADWIVDENRTKAGR